MLQASSSKPAAYYRLPLATIHSRHLLPLESSALVTFSIGTHFFVTIPGSNTALITASRRFELQVEHLNFILSIKILATRPS